MENAIQGMRREHEAVAEPVTQWCWASTSTAGCMLEAVRVDIEGDDVPTVECHVGGVPVAIVKPKARGAKGDPFIFALPKPMALLWGAGVRVRVREAGVGGVTVQIRQ